MLIAVAGNIGSGKTTLATLLSKHYNWDAHFEDVDENPYLNDFYNDMQLWSFNLQIYYMTSRISKIQEIRENKKSVIQDRTLYEDAYIFAPNLQVTWVSIARWTSTRCVLSGSAFHVPDATLCQYLVLS